MKKKIIAYKVVWENNKIYKSAITLGMITEYKMNKWVFSPKGCGPMAVFKTLKASNAFITRMGLSAFHKIHKCEIIRSKYRSLWFLTYHGNKRKIGCSRLPKGTMFANKVKLLERVGCDS